MSAGHDYPPVEDPAADTDQARLQTWSAISTGSIRDAITSAARGLDREAGPGFSLDRELSGKPDRGSAGELKPIPPGATRTTTSEAIGGDGPAIGEE